MTSDCAPSTPATRFERRSGRRRRVRGAHFLTRVFDGALDKLVLNMLQAENVSSDEMRELERLIAKARRDKQSKE